MFRSPWTVYLEIPTKTSSSLAGTSANLGGVSGVALAWMRTLVKIYTFSHCTDFWCWFHSSCVPSALPSNVRSIRVFRGRSMPILAAEDAANVLGGRLLIECEGGLADEMWLKLLLFVISNECGEHGDIINGIAVSARKPKQPNALPKPPPRRPAASSPSYLSGPPSSAGSSLSSAQTESLLRIEIWVHSSASSSTDAELETTTTTATNLDVDSAAVPVPVVAPKTVRLMEGLRAYLDRDGSSLGTRAPISIRYRPHGCA